MPEIKKAPHKTEQIKNINDIIQNFGEFVNIDEIKEINSEWLIDSFLVKNSLTMIYALAGSGKTWFVLYLAKYLLENDKIEKIFYFDADNPQRTYKQREVDKIFEFYKEKFHLVDFNASNKKSQYEFFQTLAQSDLDLQGNLFIIDSIRNFINIDFGKDHLVTKFFKDLQVLRRRGATIIYLHHQPKQYEEENNKLYKGSTAFVDSADEAYYFENKTANFDLENEKMVFTLEPQKCRDLTKPQAVVLDTKNHTFNFADFSFYGLSHKERDTLEIAKFFIIQSKTGIQQKELAKKIIKEAKENQIEILGLNAIWRLLEKYANIYFKIEKEQFKGCSYKKYFMPL